MNNFLSLCLRSGKLFPMYKIINFDIILYVHLYFSMLCLIFQVKCEQINKIEFYKSKYYQNTSNMKTAHLAACLFLLFVIEARFLSAPTQTGPLSKCEQDCNQEIQCMKECQKRRQYISKIIAVIATCLVSSLLVLCGCCLLATHKKFRKFRLNFDRKYQAIKNTYNNTNEKIMSKKQFNTHANFIIDLFNDSQTKDNFIITKNGRQIIGRANIEAVKENGLICNIQLRGLDLQGNWAASGFIVCTDDGVICWFVKEYVDINWRSDDKTKKILYKSKPSNLQRLDGIFFNLEEGSEKQYDGQWKLLQIKNSFKHSETHIEMM